PAPGRAVIVAPPLGPAIVVASGRVAPFAAPALATSLTTLLAPTAVRTFVAAALHAILAPATAVAAPFDALLESPAAPPVLGRGRAVAGQRPGRDHDGHHGHKRQHQAFHGAAGSSCSSSMMM